MWWWRCCCRCRRCGAATCRASLDRAGVAGYPLVGCHVPLSFETSANAPALSSPLDLVPGIVSQESRQLPAELLRGTEAGVWEMGNRNTGRPKAPPPTVDQCAATLPGHASREPTVGPAAQEGSRHERVWLTLLCIPRCCT